jgi:isopenicillin N synthase-like dioxygenase
MLEHYPTIEGLDRSEKNLVEEVKKGLSQFGFFYIKDTIEARLKIDQQLDDIQDAVDVYYGEDAYTGEGSVFHGTYSRFEDQKNTQVKPYFEFISRLLEIISLGLGYPQGFLQEFSRQQNYALYFYDREQEYVTYIENADRQEIVVAPHKDRSLITLVISIKGLEGYTQDAGWFSIPDREGYIMIQAGTLLQDLTQGAVKANVHRVRGFDSSKALFWSNLAPVK